MRLVTHKLYPTEQQASCLAELLELHREIYNIALEQRIFAWKQRQKSLTYIDQCALANGITTLHSGLITQSVRATLKRVEVSYQRFFTKKCGHPRFKSRKGFRSFSYQTQGNGFSLRKITKATEHTSRGVIYLAGVGEVGSRGPMLDKKLIKTLTIVRKPSGWYASFVVNVATARTHSDLVTALDWGCGQTLLTVVQTDPHGNQTTNFIENPKFLRTSQSRLKFLQKKMARQCKGSKRHSVTQHIFARTHEKISNQRLTFYHQLTHQLVSQSAHIITETLNVLGMTSARNKLSKKKTTYKRGLNKAILDSAPSLLLNLLRYKALEAGTKFTELDTKKHAFTQTCSSCHQRTGPKGFKGLLTRSWSCIQCGALHQRDENACLNMLYTSSSQALLSSTPEKQVAQRKTKTFESILNLKAIPMKRTVIQGGHFA